MEFKIIDATESSDNIIELIDENKKLGYIEFELLSGGYWRFCPQLSKEEYSILFPENEFVYLALLFIDKKHRNQGIANKLMNKFLTIIQDNFPTHKVVLAASPIDFSIPLDLLIMFYEKFGFVELVNKEDNCIMIKSN